MINTVTNIIFIALLIVCLLLNMMGQSINEVYDVTNTFDNVQEAKQGIAVDNEYFYAISDKAIGKYNKKTGKIVLRWKSKKDITHLNGGFIDGNKLICVHNPTGKNSIVTFDKNTLKKLSDKKINVDGSLTWYYPYDNTNYGVLAYYKDNVNKTKFCKFDDDFNVVKSWSFPQKIIDDIKPWSISGGFIKSGYVYASGHDKSVIYKFTMNDDKDVLTLFDTIDVVSSGQGIAFYNDDLLTINRKNHQVIKHLIRYDLE